jgi:hypothetical protein
MLEGREDLVAFVLSIPTELHLLKETKRNF